MTGEISLLFTDLLDAFSEIKQDKLISGRKMSGFICFEKADDSIDRDISFGKLNDTNLSLVDTGDSAFLALKLAQLE